MHKQTWNHEWEATWVTWQSDVQVDQIQIVNQTSYFNRLKSDWIRPNKFLWMSCLKALKIVVPRVDVQEAMRFDTPTLIINAKADISTQWQHVTSVATNDSVWFSHYPSKTKEANIVYLAAWRRLRLFVYIWQCSHAVFKHFLFLSPPLLSLLPTRPPICR